MFENELPTYAEMVWLGSRSRYEIRVLPGTGFDRRKLRALGGRRSWLPWPVAYVYKTRTDAELAALLMSLRDVGVAFFAPDHHDDHVGGHYEELRDQGLVSGPYHRLEFLRAGGWRIGPG